MTDTTEVKPDPEPGDLRVWHVPQIPCPAFRVPVATVAEGRKLLDVLADYDAFQLAERIKPDYSNVNGIERYEDDGAGTLDWFDVDDDELDEVAQKPTPAEAAQASAGFRAALAADNDRSLSEQDGRS